MDKNQGLFTLLSPVYAGCTSMLTGPDPTWLPLFSQPAADVEWTSTLRTCNSGGTVAVGVAAVIGGGAPVGRASVADCPVDYYLHHHCGMARFPQPHSYLVSEYNSCYKVCAIR